MRKLSDNLRAQMDLGMVIAIGIIFASLMVVAYIIWTVKDKLLPVAPGASTTADYNLTYYSIQNVTTGFDSAVNLLIVAITIFILAIMLGALLMLR